MMADKPHKILSHDEIRELGPGVWEVKGALPFPLKRNMTIARLPDGTLLLHSVIALSEAGMAQLDALGKPSIMIVPHGGHRMDAPFYKARYPEIRVVAPSAARAKIEQVIKVDATSEEALSSLGVRVHALDGWRHGELAYEMDTPAGKLLVASDVLANADAPPGLGGWFVAKIAGGVSGRLGVPRIMRVSMLKDKEAARASLQKLAAMADVKLLTVSHGNALTERCDEALREAAASL
jgi:hypothetical protein